MLYHIRGGKKTHLSWIHTFIYIYIDTPGTCLTPIFLALTPPKQVPNSNQNKGHLGSMYTYIYIYDVCVSLIL